MNATLKLNLGDRMIEAPAKYIRGGLAITPFARKDYSLALGWYQITHTRSGIKLPSLGITYKLRQAKRVVEWLLEFQDWDKDAEAIKATPKAIQEMMKRILRLEVSDWK